MLLLTAPGIDVNAKNAYGKTARHIAEFMRYHDIVEFLDSAGAM